MAKQTQIKVDLSGLNDLIKSFGKDHYTKVGILGGKAAEKHKKAETTILKSGKSVRHAGHEDSPFTNAEIAVVHEFGSVNRGIPQRSFLRMPIEFKKRDLIRFLGSSKIKELFEAGEIKNIFKYLGVEAENIIRDAFHSRGFGQWALNSAATIKMKGSDSPLIDTSQLQRAVSSTVVSR
jgi:hypothetical protein